ncbi:hypothetical protein [Ligaoa zhengdingensis]|jgi:hypothetical protein|uniref:hypothetical protein n=1 Tax=Ligaoa zhengdingensis TaxID=2763658 RepID=UPI00205111B9|nr:MAG TPA: hypothetical protein [Caudoviricetes sp.]
MKWPKLASPSACKIPIKIHLTDGIDEDGRPVDRATIDGLCNYSEKARQVLDAQRQLIQLEATAMLDGDIAPGMENIAGYVEINGGKITRTIYRASRARNPDGTVNFTQLELM